jgi:hypothetical protein
VHPPAQFCCLQSKARQQTRTITRPDIIAATFIAARVDSLRILRWVSVELRSSMRPMARPPSSPKLSPATPNHVTTERPNGTLQHALITTLSPLQPETYEHNNTARLDPRTEVRPFSHIRVPLESAANRLAAGGTKF